MVHFLLLLVRTRAEPVFVWIWSSSGSGKWWRRRAGSRRYSHRGRSSARCICHLTPADWPGSVKEKTDTVKIMINTVWMTFHMINMLPFFVRAHCSENTVKFGYTESLYHDLPPYNLLSIHNALEIQWNLNVQNSCYQVKEYQDKCCHIRDPQSNNAVICPHCSEPQNEMWI